MQLYQPTITGSLSVSGSVITNGTITATTLVVQTVTSSVSYLTGSTQFGSLSSNTHTFTGSMFVSGAANFSGSIITQNGIIFPTSQTISPTGSIGFNSAVGIFVYGKSGSEADFRLYNAGGLTAMSVVAGTQNISFAGNVGVGTSSPIDKLTVSGRLNLLGLNQNSIWFNQNAGGTSTGYIVGRSWSSDDVQNFFIYDVASAAFRMNITSAGNVGIGTSSPTFLLSVSQSASTTNPTLDVSNAGTYGLIGVRRGTQTNASAGINYYTTTSQKWFTGIYENSDNFGFYSVAAVGFPMVITSAGEWCLGTTTPVGAGLGNIKGSALTYNLISLQNTYTANAGNFLYFMNSAGNQAGAITHNSATTVTYYTGPSDQRLKTNITKWDENVLDLFKNINPVTFELINDNDGKKHKGFIAQEMADKFPEAYGLDKDGYYAFNPSGYIPYLVKAIQEQQAQINELKTLLNK